MAGRLVAPIECDFPISFKVPLTIPTYQLPRTSKSREPIGRCADGAGAETTGLQQFVLAMLRSSKREQSRLVDSRCTTAVAVAVWLSALVGSAETIESFAVDETLN